MAKYPKMSSVPVILSRSDVTKNLDPRAMVSWLGEAFQIHSYKGDASLRHAHHLCLPKGSLVASNFGVLDGIPAYSLKVESRMPRDNPSASGYVHLFSEESGRLLALLESSYISSVGSALTGALAADLLAGPDAKSVAVIGNGAQGWLGLRFLMEMRNLSEVTLFDLNRRKSCRMAERLKKYKNLEVRVCDSLNGAVSNADIVSCATGSSQAFLFSEMVKPGAHVSTLGADEIGKRELSEELLKACSFFCDDRNLVLSVGPLAGIDEARGLVRGELGEVLSGVKKGRRSDEELTIYGAVGLPFVDLIAAWCTYQKALKTGVEQLKSIT